MNAKEEEFEPPTKVVIEYLFRDMLFCTQYIIFKKQKQSNEHCLLQFRAQTWDFIPGHVLRVPIAPPQWE